jgi:hypothetical protein
MKRDLLALLVLLTMAFRAEAADIRQIATQSLGCIGVNYLNEIMQLQREGDAAAAAALAKQQIEGQLCTSFNVGDRVFVEGANGDFLVVHKEGDPRPWWIAQEAVGGR